MNMASIVPDRTNPWVTLPEGPALGMGLVDTIKVNKLVRLYKKMG
jgi:hypothetical protein